MRVRTRVDADLDGCARLVAVGHVSDGYPAYVPDDVRGFVASTHACAAWVAEVGGQLVGARGVARPRLSGGDGPVREAIGVTDHGLAVVARLLVTSTARRQGLGRALLATASGAATARGLRPIVDVATHYEPAIQLCEAGGWVRIGTATVHVPDRAGL